MSAPTKKQYGQSTANMHREYGRAVKKIQGKLSKGGTYDHACDTLTDISQKIKTFVKKAFFKIIIRETEAIWSRKPQKNN